MKNFNSLMIMVLSIALFSCEKENVEVIDSSSPDGSALIAKGGGADGPTVDPLQQTLQWSSFITMQVLYDEPDARPDFMAALSTGNVVQMEDLIGPNVDSEFRDAFMSYLYYYIDLELNNGLPKGEGDPPPVPVTQGPPDPPCPPFQTCPPSVQSYVNFFVDEILVDNCIELYVPNALSLGGDSFEMTSTAHPLDSTDSNDGRRKGSTYFEGPSEESGYWAIWITLQTVDDTYVNNHDNIIVARPFRPGATGPSGPCNYAGYPADFTLFLD